MSRFGQAVSEIQALEGVSRKDRWMNRIHPLSKVCLTVFYILLTVSFHKYDLTGLFSMILYPAAVLMIADLSLRDALRRLRLAFALILVMGILNPFFDRTPFLQIGSFILTGGVISMLTLFLKASFTVTAAYLLIATTPMDEICRALRILRVPKILVTLILLIWRYITMLMKEAGRVTDAYSLRAPGQKGIHFRAWGPLAGQLLLRSADFAGVLYESMLLRGFTGEFNTGLRHTFRPSDILWPMVWAGLLVVFRLFPVLSILGSLVTGAGL